MRTCGAGQFLQILAVMLSADAINLLDAFSKQSRASSYFDCGAFLVNLSSVFWYDKLILAQPSRASTHFFSNTYHLMRTGTHNCLFVYAHPNIKEYLYMSDTSTTSTLSGQHDVQQLYRTVFCPNCSSPNIQTKNYGKKTGGTIGTVAGTAVGISSAMAGAEVGAIVGMLAGPIGIGIGSIAGAILGGLFGGAAGCATGATLGEVIDNTLLDNYHCRDCDFTFNKQIPSDR